MTDIKDYIAIARLLWPSIVAAAAVGVGGSLVGTFVLLRREGLTALALPQVVAAGAAVGLKMGWPTLPPALCAVAMAVIFLALSRRAGSSHWLLPSIYV